MASSPIVDIEQLTAPIAGEKAVGEDPRADSSPTSPYYQIKDMRSRARKAERAFEMGDDEGDPPDWRPILDAAPEVLVNQAKDLEVTAYYCEAMAREHGFAGLRDGFQLIHQLIDKYGDEIYPLPDEDGEETRVAPLSGLNGEGGNGTLITPIGKIPLTGDTSHGEFGQSAYVQAQDLERAPDDVKERRISQGAVSMETFLAAVSETSGDFFVNLMEDLEGARQAYAEMTAALDAKYGHSSPPSSQIRQLLDDCKQTVETVARDKLAAAAAVAEAEQAEEEAQAEAESGDGQASEQPSSRPKMTVGSIENRDDAFREIIRIAQYFRKTEPHSPISYALEQIVRWGRLPLPHLLKELISDESSISQMFRLVGIRGDESSEETADA